ncbi:MAG: S8 family serine peptidase [Flavobacteriales bacterium]|jgi:serine protease
MIMKFTITFFAALMIFSSTQAQTLPYVPGEIIVMTQEKGDVYKITQDLNREHGVFARVEVKELLSAPMRTWLLGFDESAVSMSEMLYSTKKNPQVKLAQTNKILEERIIPNDPFFSQQWHHANGNDRDIDSPEAWDITTGGLTATGDDIVVCVVENNGSNWQQADIVDNHWVNEHEIPNNGIDDDENGYVDDYDGWHVVNLDDNLGTGGHGTQVSSMIGAKGDNAAGITGVNWDVKIMQVQLGSIVESRVVASYSYALTMRKMYNETNGAKGAFVVATNSSWGIDGGQPADAPIWCAMYDSLGTYGVISCGATANNDVNIDVVGDLPTACPSEYLVSVTATDNNDVRTFSGYGTTHVDLGAPGEDVFLAGNNNYNTTSGTSFATPCVAGAIALLYSAPCASFMAQVYADPSLGAELMIDYILNGVDPVSNLTDETVTGGRLNVKTSLDLLLAACSNNPCLSPFNLEAQLIEGTNNYTFVWNSISETQTFNFRYRIVGEQVWIVVNSIETESITINDLSICTEYEYQVQSICSGGESDWSTIQTLLSDGCCVNPDVVVISNVTSTSGNLIWNNVTAAESYTIALTANGNTQLIEGLESNVYSFSNLEPCTDYLIQVYTVCASNELAPPVSYALSTFGCGSCTDFDYCAVTADSELEWIASVEVNNLSNSTGSNNGYEFFSDITTALELGATYDLTLTPGFDGTSYDEYFKAWIDFNGDGIFQDSEEIFDSGDGSPDAVSGTFEVPGTATLGSTRMRVGMSYFGFFGGGVPPQCGEINYGEYEDYCVQIETLSAVKEENTNVINISPNPANDLIRWNDSLKEISIINASGQVVMQEFSFLKNELQIGALPNGIYFIKAQGTNGINYYNKLVVSR